MWKKCSLVDDKLEMHIIPNLTCWNIDLSSTVQYNSTKSEKLPFINHLETVQVTFCSQALARKHRLYEFQRSFVSLDNREMYMLASRREVIAKKCIHAGEQPSRNRNVVNVIRRYACSRRDVLACWFV